MADVQGISGQPVPETLLAKTAGRHRKLNSSLLSGGRRRQLRYRVRSSFTKVRGATSRVNALQTSSCTRKMKRADCKDNQLVDSFSGACHLAVIGDPAAPQCGKKTVENSDLSWSTPCPVKATQRFSHNPLTSAKSKFLLQKALYTLPTEDCMVIWSPSENVWQTDNEDGDKRNGITNAPRSILRSSSTPTPKTIFRRNYDVQRYSSFRFQMSSKQSHLTASDPSTASVAQSALRRAAQSREADSRAASSFVNHAAMPRAAHPGGCTQVNGQLKKPLYHNLTQRFYRFRETEKLKRASTQKPVLPVLHKQRQRRFLLTRWEN